MLRGWCQCLIDANAISYIEASTFLCSIIEVVPRGYDWDEDPDCPENFFNRPDLLDRGEYMYSSMWDHEYEAWDDILVIIEAIHRWTLIRNGKIVFELKNHGE